MSETQKIKNLKKEQKFLVIIVCFGLLILGVVGVAGLMLVEDAGDRLVTIRDANDDVFCIQKGYMGAVGVNFINTNLWDRWVGCVTSDGDSITFLRYTHTIIINNTGGD